MPATERLIAAARESRLIIFAGAGISMGAPTSLPSWRDVNRLVIGSLAEQAAAVIGDDLATKAADLVLARHEVEKLPPEYQAQVLAELLHDRYFEVLRYLDSDRPNANHLAIAWLAKLGCVRAVITTNFDRVLETAFRAVGVPLECHYQPEHFERLATDPPRFDRPGTCQLLKLHGSVDDPSTLIDTLAQRKRGFPICVLDCVRFLLGEGHWLFLGFSGLDLEAEPSYLGIAQHADRARGFSWFVRENTPPRPAVVKLASRYAARGEIVSGNLPEWLLEFCSSVSNAPRTWIDEHRSQRAFEPRVEATTALERGARDWAAQLGGNVCSMALAFVVSACAQPLVALDVVKAVLAELAAADDASAGFLLTKALAANALCVLLAGFGRHEEAVRLGFEAIDLATTADDPDSADRIRCNVARSLETLGRVDEALKMLTSAVSAYRHRGDDQMIAAGLNALADHLTRQVQLQRARETAQQAREHARRAGDERLRGAALNTLGIIAKLQAEYAPALACFEECETLFARLGNDEAVAAAACNRGEVLAATGRHEEAAQIYREVSTVVERLGRLDNQGALYLSLGSLAMHCGDPKTAERWFEAAVQVFRGIADPANTAFAAGRLAEAHAASGDHARALAIASEALPLVSDRNRAFKANLLNQIGHSSLRLGRLKDAERAYVEIVTIATSTGNVSSRAAAAMNIGTITLLQQSDAEAAQWFAHAARLWQQLGREDELEYCQLGVAAVTLDQRLARLSDEGHRKSQPSEQRAAAREMLSLYPQLIDMYRRLGALQLVAAFCASAASTARFAGDLPQAAVWSEEAAKTWRELRG